MTLNRIVVWAVVGLFLVIVAAYSLFFSGRTGQYETFEDYRFGTYVRVKVSSKVRPSTIAKAIFAEMRRLEEKYDPFRVGTLLHRINNSDDWVEVDDETLALVDYALKLSKQTEGAFDPTLGRLVELWGFSKYSQRSESEFRVPSPAEIKDALELSGHKKVAIDYRRKAVRTNGAWLDFGGLLKGYALKRAYQIAKELDRDCHGFVEAGGQIMILGPKYGRANWTIGVRNPRGEPNDSIAYVYLRSGSIATSGDYERYFVVDGVRYHHIIDPRTGLPASGAVSATVISDDPIVADALSTASFVFGKDRWLFAKVLAPSLGAEVMLVTPEGKVLKTDNFSVFENPDR